MKSTFGPASAALILLIAGPLTIWSFVMFLLLLTGAADIGLIGMEGYLGLLALTALGALACRRSIIVLRKRGGKNKRSRVSRAVMLLGIVALAQVPVTMWRNESYSDMFNG